MSHSVAKPMLESRNGLWQGEDDRISVSMDNETFFAFVSAYLAAQGLKEPSREQVDHAFIRCSAVSYWYKCVDPRVDIKEKKDANGDATKRDSTHPPTN